MKNKVILSIDCGFKGGLCFWQDLKPSVIMPMPIKANKTLNMPYIMNLIRDADVVIIEEQFDPHSKNQRGMRTNIMNWGMIRGVAMALNKEVIDVNANEWVTSLGLSNRGRSPMLPKSTKKDRAKKANMLYNINIDPKDDGLADAILIGHYQLKKMRAI